MLVRIFSGRHGVASEAKKASQQITSELSAVPGVSSVAESTIPLLEGSDASANVTVHGFEAGPDAVGHTLRRLDPPEPAPLGRSQGGGGTGRERGARLGS
mgnify:CR=1 FL=1